MSASPHNVHTPRDMRGSARPHGTSGGRNGALSPSTTTGRVTGAQLYAAHRLAGLTRDRRSTGAHDADNGSTGVTSGSLNDRATRVGGYSHLSHQDGEALRQQFIAEHDALPEDQRAHWADQARQQNEASDNGGAGMTHERAFGALTGDDGTGPLDGGDDFPVSTTRRAPPIQNIAGTPQATAKALLDVSAANKQDGPLGSGYGTARIIHEAPKAGDSTSIDADGTRHIVRPDGGEVTMPAVQRQDAPDSDPAFAATDGRRTGIYVNGHEQVRQDDGSYVPGRGDALALTPQAPTNDPLSTAASAFPVSTTPKPDKMTAGILNGTAANADDDALPSSFGTAQTPTDNLTSSLLSGLTSPAAPNTSSPTVAASGGNQPKPAAPDNTAAASAPDDTEEGTEYAFPGSAPKPFRRPRPAAFR